MGRVLWKLEVDCLLSGELLSGEHIPGTVAKLDCVLKREFELGVEALESKRLIVGWFFLICGSASLFLSSSGS